MRYVIGERGFGKTTYCLDWMLEGRSLGGYPGWNRGIIVPNQQHRIRVTKQLGERFNWVCEKLLHETVSSRPASSFYLRYKHLLELPDYTTFDLKKAVWSFQEGRRMHGMSREVEFCIDEYGWLSDWERYLLAGSTFYGQIKFVTLTEFTRDEVVYLDRPDPSKALW